MLHRDMVLVLSHIFCRRYLHPNVALRLKGAAKGASGSVVILPELPEDARASLERYSHPGRDNRSFVNVQ